MCTYSSPPNYLLFLLLVHRCGISNVANIRLFFYVQSEEQAKSVQSYYTTKFFRFLVSLRKITQHATHSTYQWVPIQQWNKLWTDEDLFKKYKLTSEDVEYIDKMIKRMDI